MQEFLQNSAFRPTSAQHLLSFSHWVHHFLAIFSKVDEFAQNSVFSPRLARFVFFALGAERLSDFQQSARVSARQSFQTEISSFCYFCTGRTTLSAISAKCTSLYKTAFSARDQHILSFSHWAHHFLAIFSKVHKFVQNSVFSPRSARFVIFALSKPLFSNFQQSERVFSKHGFQHGFQCTSLYKTVFSARDRHILSFFHWAHHFLAIFSKVHKFVQNSVVIPRSARFVIFVLGAPLFSGFQQSAGVCT